MSFLGNLAKSLPVVGDVFRGFEQDAAAKKVVVPDDPTYVESPEIKARLAYAKTLLGARRPGAAIATNNILTSGANAVNNINANATSGAQAIALANGVQGTTNNAFLQEAAADEQFAQQARQELAAAQEADANEGRMVYNDLVRKRYNAVNERNQYKTAADASFANFGNTITSLALSAVAPGSGSLVGKKSKNPFNGISDSDLQAVYNG